jgi:hypothetical protein
VRNLASFLELLRYAVNFFWENFRKLTYVETLFERKRQMHGYDVTLSASYMEIYRDEVYDLFVDRETVGLIL